MTTQPGPPHGQHGPTSPHPGPYPPPGAGQASSDVTQPVRYPPSGVLTEPEPAKSNFGVVLAALAAGSLVSVAVGVYAGLHEGTGFGFNLGIFSTGLAAKAWLTSVVFLLAMVQLVSSLMIYGKLPGGGKVVSGLHRWSGRAAVLVSLPVAAHCLYAMGFQSFDTRVLMHSLLGTLIYGIFVCKMVLLTREDSPGWALPVFGGLLFTGFTGLWLTSSLWFFSTFGAVF